MQGSVTGGRVMLVPLAMIAAADAACAQTGLGAVQFENWGFYQKNANGSGQWQVDPRLYLPFAFGNGWVVTARADLPMIYTDDSGPAHPGGGYSGGMGNALIEAVVDTPEVAPNLSLRAGLRLVFPSPKAEPFGKDNQYQIAPGIGLIYKMPGTLNGVTLAPYVRYFRGFNPQSADTSRVNSLYVYPSLTLGLNPQWSVVFYPEHPITYDHDKGSWFVPLDLLFVHSASERIRFAIGGAFKLRNPASPSYNYIVNGRATFFF